jgi:hypothetical protein
MEQKRNNFTDEELIEAYNQEKHLGKLAVKFGVPHIQMWRKCKLLGLEFNSSGGGNNGRFLLSDILKGLHPYYQTNKLRKRLIREGIFENKCSSCGIHEWNKKPIVMQLDHVNGDSSDHRKKNLRLLCPNCHSQTDTWCGKNKP